MKHNRSITLCSLLLTLSSCSGGGGAGSNGGTTQPVAVGIDVLEPAPGAIINDTTPQVIFSFTGATPDLTTLRVEVDGLPIDLGSQWTVGLLGASGPTDPVEDGDHELLIGVRRMAGSDETIVTVPFSTSTGGGTTRVTGRLLDPDGDVPIVGASIWIEEDPGNQVLTDATGTYVLDDAQHGDGVHLLFDPRALQFSDPGGEPYVYPLYKRPIDVIQGATNVPDDCFLPKIFAITTFSALELAGVFDCATATFLTDYELTKEDILQDPNEIVSVTVTIPQGTRVEFLDGAVACDQFLSIAPVDEANAPSNLPPGLDPSLLVTVQPTGMKFREPGGAIASLPITFPNRDDLAVDNVVDLFSVDHETGEFIVMGTMEPDPADPSQLITISGGLQGGSWHCSCPPGLPADTDVEGDSCGGGAGSTTVNPMVDTQTGFVQERIALPRRTLFDEAFGFGLIYDSETVAPERLALTDATIPVQSAVPNLISVTAEVAGLPAGTTRWFNSAGLSESSTSQLVLPYTFNFDQFATGFYPYELEVRSHYGSASVASFVEGDMPVVRRGDSPFGRGWELIGNDRIIESSEGELGLFRGMGDVHRFKPETLDMHLWNQEGPLSNGSWVVAADGNSVMQTTNGQATFFATPTVIEADVVKGTMRTTNNDDDFIGFAFGFNAPIADEGDPPTECDYYLFHWARNTQGQHPAGKTLQRCSMVGGVPTVEVLATQHGSGQGWILGAFHDFELEYEPNRIRIRIDDDVVFDLEAPYQPGRFAYFNHSQASTFYSAIVTDDIVLYEGVGVERSTILRTDNGYERSFPDGGFELFGADGWVMERRDRRGRTTVFVRDANGRIERIVDPVGGETLFEYSGDLIARITDPGQRVIEFEHSGSDLTEVRDADGNEWCYEYSADGLLTATVDADDRRNEHDYDARSRYFRTTYPDGTMVEVEPANSALLALVDQASDQGNAPVPIDPSNLVGVRTDELGRERRFRRLLGDDVRVQMEEDLPGDGLRTTESTVDRDLGYLRRVRVYEGVKGKPFAAIVEERTYVWDEVRAVILSETRSGLGIAPDRITEYAWDTGHDWVLSRTERGSGSETPRVTTYQRDTLGNILAVDPPGLTGSVLMQYDTQNGSPMTRLEDSNGVTVFERDSATRSTTRITTGAVDTLLVRNLLGQVIAVEKADGARTTYFYDGSGRLVEAVDGAGGEVNYERTATGLLARVVDGKTPPGVNRFLRDARGRITSWFDALERELSYEYLADGSLDRVVDRRGVELDYSYDIAGRLIRVDFSLEGQASDSLELTYAELDRVASAVVPGSHIEYEYSPFGDMTVERELLAQPTSEVEYGYDGFGGRTTLAVKVADIAIHSLVTTFDDAGRVNTLTDAAVGVFELVHDAGDRRTMLKRPGGIDSTYAYGDARVATSVSVSGPGGLLLSDDSALDSHTNLISLLQVRTLLPGLALGLDYDDADRLESVMGGLDADYGPYDEAGNRNSDLFQYDQGDALLADNVEQFEYDANGNLTTIRDIASGELERTLEYDLHNRLNLVTDVDGGSPTIAMWAGYDAGGRRIDLNGQRLVYAGNDVVAVVEDAEVVEVITHGPGIDEPLAIRDTGTEDVLLTVADLLGSIAQYVQLSAPSQSAAELRYDAFGAIVEQAWGVRQPRMLYGYRARAYDEHTGLHYLRARYYDSEHGRFLSPEPLLMSFFGSGVPGETNPYQYGRANPMKYRDPFGTEALSCPATEADCSSNSDFSRMPEYNENSTHCGYHCYLEARPEFNWVFPDERAECCYSSEELVDDPANDCVGTNNEYPKMHPFHWAPFGPDDGGIWRNRGRLWRQKVVKPWNNFWNRVNNSINDAMDKIADPDCWTYGCE